MPAPRGPRPPCRRARRCSREPGTASARPAAMRRGELTAHASAPCPSRSRRRGSAASEPIRGRLPSRGGVHPHSRTNRRNQPRTATPRPPARRIGSALRRSRQRASISRRSGCSRSWKLRGSCREPSTIRPRAARCRPAPPPRSRALAKARRTHPRNCRGVAGCISTRCRG